MKTGIIFIFHNYQKDIDVNFFVNYFTRLESIEFCLVNNNSKDDTYLILKEIKDVCKNVSIVNMKKFKSDISAVKAGARYMNNSFKIKHLGYVNSNLLNKQYQGLNTIIKTIYMNQDRIIKYDKKVLKSYSKKKTLFQKLFSVIDYLKKIEIEKQVDYHQYQSKF